MTKPEAAKASPLRTVDQACEQLGVERSKLYELMRQGHIASIKLPPGTAQSGRRIEQAELDAFIVRNRVQS